MNVEIVKELLDTCFLAKKITEMTPTLPTGMAPRHNNIIDAIYVLSQEKERVFISDISKRLNTTAPSITKLVGQLEKMGYLIKIGHKEDKRFVSLQLTDAGVAHYEAFVRSYHNDLAEILAVLSDEECRTAIDVVKTLYAKVEAYSNQE